MKNRTQLSLLTARLFCGATLMAQEYDGIKDGSIATVTREEISGAKTIDKTGHSSCARVH